MASWTKGEVRWSCSVMSSSLRPTDCSLPGSSIHGIFQARVREWVAISFSRGSSRPRDQTQVSCIVGRCFTVWTTREVLKCHLNLKKYNQVEKEGAQSSQFYEARPCILNEIILPPGEFKLIPKRGNLTLLSTKYRRLWYIYRITLYQYHQDFMGEW